MFFHIQIWKMGIMVMQWLALVSHKKGTQTEKVLGLGPRGGQGPSCEECVLHVSLLSRCSSLFPIVQHININIFHIGV